MNKPLITIGITCFNAEDTIERAVLSALHQDWPNKEILIVDDASSDGSIAVLNGLVNKYPEVQIIQHSNNCGYPCALNSIIEKAHGEFIAIFDDDDVSIPSRLNEQYQRIQDYEVKSGSSLIFCYSNRAVIKAGQNSPDHIAKALGRKACEPHGIAVVDYIFGFKSHPEFVWGLFGSCTLMARRETFNRIGPFDETFRRCAEWDYAIRGGFQYAHFIAVDKALITQYKTPSMDKSGAIPLQYDLKIRVKYKSFLKAKKAYWASRIISHARFTGSKGNILKSKLLVILACLTSPPMLINRITKYLGLLNRNMLKNRNYRN